MNYGVILSYVVAAATLAFVLAPLFGADPGRLRRGTSNESWLSLAQLDLDRELGKVDEAEYEELQKRARSSLPSFPLEAFVYSYRAARRQDKALESEILVVRARRRSSK